jgi:hypothetical protein
LRLSGIAPSLCFAVGLGRPSFNGRRDEGERHHSWFRQPKYITPEFNPLASHTQIARGRCFKHGCAGRILASGRTEGGPLRHCRSDTQRCRVPTRQLWGQGKAAGLIHDRRLCCLWIYPDRTLLRTDERNFSADECWRKHYAGKHEGKRHTDESKNKAVDGMLTIGFIVRTLVGLGAFLTSIKDAGCDAVLGLCAASFRQRAVSPLRWDEGLRPPEVWGPLLSMSGASAVSGNSLALRLASVSTRQHTNELRSNSRLARCKGGIKSLMVENMSSPRRFPPPSSADDMGGCFVVKVRNE